MLQNIDRQKGTTMTEFAVIALLFCIFVFGIFEGARLIFLYDSVAVGAERGARYAATHIGCAAIPLLSDNTSCSPLGTIDAQTAVTQYVHGIPGLSSAGVTVSFPNGSVPNTVQAAPATAIVTVTLTYTGVLPALIPAFATIPIQSTAQMTLNGF